MAIMALLLVSLAPAISHAVQGKSGGFWAEVCTALGSKVVDGPKLGGEDPAPAAALLHALDHCPYCSLHLPGIGLAPTALGVSLLPLGFEVPHLFLQGPYTLHAWYRALSRGPPSSA